MRTMADIERDIEDLQNAFYKVEREYESKLSKLRAEKSRMNGYRFRFRVVGRPYARYEATVAIGEYTDRYDAECALSKWLNEHHPNNWEWSYGQFVFKNSGGSGYVAGRIDDLYYHPEGLHLPHDVQVEME